ncbi:hypothetical protein [Streptomyces sp. NRRL S-87]|uniref:hypothetical protein n=1 Tax=Streptomyces sp. NRRL S-87 TaxID=1463920 RepID=UPI0004C2A76A|nr:hypothetical protein [Streptomyces sp. NRRL S-87]
MTEMIVFWGVLAAVSGAAAAVLLRRRNGRTRNADGLLVERAARDAAVDYRSADNGLAVHRVTPPMGDGFRG